MRPIGTESLGSFLPLVLAVLSLPVEAKAEIGEFGFDSCVAVFGQFCPVESGGVTVLIASLFLFGGIPLRWALRVYAKKESRECQAIPQVQYCRFCTPKLVQ